jgi:diguanylate cyclase (GGDEF)-like protein
MNDTEKIIETSQTTVLGSVREVSVDHDDLEPYLVILSGQDQGRQYRLSRQFNTFGRTRDVHIMIADAKISRKHGVFIIHPDGIILKDFQSTNGCYVNDIRVERQVIELTSRIRAGNTLMKIEYKKASEVESEIDLYKAANIDALTNIPNRRAFMIRAQEEFSFSKRNNYYLTIIMCDVDHFKRINDNFGHPAGDQVLKKLAKFLQAQMRKEDMLSRYGGEEFIMLLRDTNANSASRWAERVREKVGQINFSVQNKNISATLSIGVCSKNGGEITSLNAIIKEADDALYLAKNNGRNRVEMA